MAFQTRAANATLSEMNITPLVDVMLVLLIIFMVAAPLLSRPLTLDLPQHAPDPAPIPESIVLRIDADGGLQWNGMPMSQLAVASLMRLEATRAEPPLLRLEVSQQADYAQFAAVLGEARAAGLERIGLPEN